MRKILALAALLASAAAPATIPAPALAQALDANTFRTMAARSDAFEIATSRLALERSRNSLVRSYAQRMITDHGETSQALNGGRPVYTAQGTLASPNALSGTLAGAGLGAILGGPVGAAVGAGVGATAGAATGQAPQTTGSVPPSTALDPQKAQMLSQLASLQGAQFDRLYGRVQVMAHQEAIDLYSTYAQSGDDPQLVQFAQSVLPHLQNHLNRARRLPGGSTAAR